MFPGLAPRLQDAAKVEITNQGKTTMIAQRKATAGAWPATGGYPVLDTKLRELLTGLTELRLVEPRTAEPGQLARLGLEDPTRRTRQRQPAARAGCAGG